MTPEHNLIEAVLAMHGIVPSQAGVDGTLASPSVQTALAEVRTKPEPVLRWEGDSLHLGGVKVGEVWRAIHQWGWVVSPDAKELEGFVPTKAKARTAAEQAVRDWLKRAGVV